MLKMKLKNSLFFRFLLLVFNCSLITLTSSQVTSSISYENTIGFDILWAQSPFSDNSILLRVAILDFNSYNYTCNIPKVMFRIAIPGQEQIIKLDLSDADNAEIDSDNFCGKPKVKEEESKKKRKRFFEERGLYGRHDHSSTAAPAPAPTPTPTGSTSPAETPSSEPKETRQLPVHDKVKVLAFSNEFVLIYYKCGNTGVCGSIYSIKNIQTKVSSIKLEGNCDDMTAVKGSNGFLYLCYKAGDLSISYSNWYVEEGNKFTMVGEGIISNVTIPNASQAEGFSGGLLKTFATGPKTYSIVMGTYNYKPSINEDFYSVPIKIYAYFLTNENSIIDPYLIYENIGQTNYDLIQFAIQICHPQADGNGYKCLVSLKSDESSTNTKFVSIQFLPTGEVISKFEFDVSPAKEVTTTLNLSKGGYCIGVVNEIEDKEVVDGLIYNNDGIYSRSWGMPSNIDYYDGKVGVTPNSLVWGTESISIDQTGFWRVFMSQL